ncbi:MAG: DUF452 family protein [Rikenellaceae bacterium]|nr:DUF452 family protein [Rikenellaceae bacterium]MCL2692420.1 DUF452 family protein [Rikenellaceae bacterium]
MEKHWLRRTGERQLVIFVLGWGAGPAVVEHVAKLLHADVLVVCDHRDIEPLSEAELAEIEAYGERFLFAWSLGIVAAECIFGDTKFTRAVALNGTPLPLDDETGIGRRRFVATQKALANAGSDEFNRRAYGEFYKKEFTPRGLHADIDELAELKALAEKTQYSSIAWDKAVVGAYDAIFPPENMLRYWRQHAELRPLPHYPFADADIILREIDNR